MSEWSLEPKSDEIKLDRLKLWNKIIGLRTHKKTRTHTQNWKLICNYRLKVINNEVRKND